MPAFDLLTPWITFAVILYPLLFLERWIHQHFYGVGWLLTQDKERATMIYYLVFMPGVFLHEFTQWLAAGALRVRIRKIKVWPKPQTNGTLRLDFVQLRKTTRLRSAIIGLIPLLSGIGVVLFISQNVFDVKGISGALATGDLDIVLAEFQRLFSTPDFWLWLYILFAIGNAMMPTPSDRQDWPLLIAVLGAIALFLVIIGLGEKVLLPTLRGPITQMLNTLVTAFSTVLVLDLFAVVLLGLLEQGLERTTGAQAKYPKPKRAREPKPEPGGEKPLPPDKAPQRITERALPIPPGPIQRRKKKKPAPVEPPEQQPYRPELERFTPTWQHEAPPQEETPEEEMPESTEEYRPPSYDWQTEEADMQAPYDEGTSYETAEEEARDEDYLNVYTRSQDEAENPYENEGSYDDSDDDELRYEPLDDMP